MVSNYLSVCKELSNAGTHPNRYVTHVRVFGAIRPESGTRLRAACWQIYCLSRRNWQDWQAEATPMAPKGQ